LEEVHKERANEIIQPLSVIQKSIVLRSSFMHLSHGRPNVVLLISFVVLVLLGFAMLASASQVLGFTRFGDEFYFFKNQITHAIVGIIVFFVFYYFPTTYWRRFAVPLYFVGVLLLAIVLIPGVSYGSAKSWIQIAGLSIQPAELMKVFLVFFFSYWFEKRSEYGKSFFLGLVPFLVYAGIPLALIALQPDVGTLIIVGAICVAIYFVSGASWKLFGLLGVFGIIGVGSMIAAAPYRLNRVMVLLNPSLDPQGAGYHARRAIEAVESGGLFGLGFGKSVSKFHLLPEAPADSIFAVYAEELGFVFVVLLFVLFGLLVAFGFRVAEGAQTKFESYACAGIVMWIVVQAAANIGSMIGMLPLTGVPLPFLSYGATALISLLAAMGFLLNVSKNARV